MKRVGVFLLLLLFLPGCTGKHDEIERGMALRARLLKASACCFDADITADYGDTLHVFSLHCQGDPMGNLNFTVTAPETISGITGTVAEEGGKLTFADTALHFGLLAEEQIAPVTAPWIFLRTLRSGYLTAAGMEGELLRLTLDDSFEEDALKLDIWLDEENIPIRCEILYEGRRILSLEVKNFQIM